MTIDLKTAMMQPVESVEADLMTIDGRQQWIAKLDGRLIEVWNIRFDVKLERNWSQNYSRI